MKRLLENLGQALIYGIFFFVVLVPVFAHFDFSFGACYSICIVLGLFLSILYENNELLVKIMEKEDEK